MNASSRNSPCPCGSGKRYKDCHGSIAGQGGARWLPVEPTQRRLNAALSAQLAGRLTEAIALYEAVVAEQPDLFDALHMLGVAYYQCGEFERAKDLVASAVRLLPTDGAARFNLGLIQSVLERRGVERDICRETLPRLSRRCVVPPAGVVEPTRCIPTLDLVVSRADAFASLGIVERLASWLQTPSPIVWTYAEMPKPESTRWPVRVIDAHGGIIPDRSHALFVGADRSPAEWYARSGATDVALYCDGEGPCVLLDRIPELSREGATPLRLLFGSAAYANRIGLPGIVVPDLAAAT